MNNNNELLHRLWVAHDHVPASTDENGKDREAIREAIYLIDALKKQLIDENNE